MDKKPYHKPYHYNLIQSFGFAFEGIWFALRFERNLRVHLCIAVLLTYFSTRYYRLSKVEAAVLILAICLVIVCELLNTSLEKAIDIQASDFNLLAKIAKDVAAGAVLLSALGSIIIGALLFWEPAILAQIASDMLRQFYIWIPIFIAMLAVIFLPEKQIS